MTRINLLSPSELADQHLLAEWRELPRIVTIVRNKIIQHKPIIVGVKYTMGAGHVRFFYNKLLFLSQRHQVLVAEALKRGFHLGYVDQISLADIPKCYCQDYQPSQEDLQISLTRIYDKLQQKPDWYTRYGKSKDICDWYHRQSFLITLS